MKETEEKYLFQIIKLKDDIIERSEAIIKLNADIRQSSERQHKYEEILIKYSCPHAVRNKHNNEVVFRAVFEDI